MPSASQCTGLLSGFIRAVGTFTEWGCSALFSKCSSAGLDKILYGDGGGGLVSSGCGRSCMWLFLRWSGVLGGEFEADEGARVGEEVTDEGGRAVGSISRSGMGGETNGLRVMRRSTNRKIALGEGINTATTTI